MTRYFCDYAWLGATPAAMGGATPAVVGDATPRGATGAAPTGGTEAARDVLLEIVGDRFVSVVPCATRPSDAVHLRGLTIPGLANVHSHAFHRALRGRAQSGPRTFWAWREQMFLVAAVLTPDTYYELARATYAEMALTGITAVGEFHYLHHARDGRPYADPNAMGEALLAAAVEAGIRITLLDACYLESAPGRPVEGPQRRFADESVDIWAARAEGLVAGPGARTGAAIHSMRAVPPGAAAVVASAARRRGVPLHFHLSEQVAENEATLAAYGASPTELLVAAGALGGSSTAVHATHLTPSDLERLGESRTGACICPTTERDLADGIGPARRLASAGSPVTLGSDSQAVIDLFQEMHGLEDAERLATGARGNFAASELLVAATRDGHAALGWPECGFIVPGAVADLVTVSLGSPRLADADLDVRDIVAHVVFAASASDVTDVVVGGRPVVSGGRHRLVGDVATALRRSVATVLDS